MVNPDFYQKSSTYDFFLKLFGYEASLQRYLQHLDLTCPSDCQVLDAGCGTGILGLHFLQRYEKARLTAFDLERNFLDAVASNAKQKGIDASRLTLGVGDISSPQKLESLEGEKLELSDESFDVICVGAVVGYASDIEASVRKLVHLLRRGGYLINIEMNEALAGRYVSKRFHYQNIQIQRMLEVIREEGCDVLDAPMKLTHLPGKLTRTAIVARR